MSFMHGLDYLVQQSGRRIEVGKSLAKIDSLVICGQLAHNSKNGGPYIGKL